VSASPNSRRQRVAFISTSYPSDDDDCAGHFVRAEVRRALDEGHDVTVIAPKARRAYHDDAARIIALPHLGAFGTPGALARLRWRPDRWIGAFLWVMTARWTLRRLGPFDRCVAHFLVPGCWPIGSSAPARLEGVVHGSDLRLLEALPGWPRRCVVNRLRLLRPSVRCVSEDLARRLTKLLGADHDVPITVSPSPIDVPQLPDRAQLRSQLGVGSERLVVIASRLIQSKRVDIALRAALRQPQAKVVVCGGGPELARLRRRFPNAQFFGQLPRRRVLEWIAASDLVVSASRDEGAPTVVREARALGVPVLAAPAGDIAKWAEADPGISVFGD
jgi:teichuronic acid biosynthesis glycosyltransferase TuaC